MDISQFQFLSELNTANRIREQGFNLVDESDEGKPLICGVKQDIDGIHLTLNDKASTLCALHGIEIIYDIIHANKMYNKNEENLPSHIFFENSEPLYKTRVIINQNTSTELKEGIQISKGSIFNDYFQYVKDSWYENEDFEEFRLYDKALAGDSPINVINEYFDEKFMNTGMNEILYYDYPKSKGFPSNLLEAIISHYKKLYMNKTYIFHNNFKMKIPKFLNDYNDFLKNNYHEIIFKNTSELDLQIREKDVGTYPLEKALEAGKRIYEVRRLDSEDIKLKLNKEKLGILTNHIKIKDDFVLEYDMLDEGELQKGLWETQLCLDIINYIFKEGIYIPSTTFLKPVKILKAKGKSVNHVEHLMKVNKQPYTKQELSGEKILYSRSIEPRSYDLRCNQKKLKFDINGPKINKGLIKLLVQSSRSESHGIKGLFEMTNLEDFLEY